MPRRRAVSLYYGSIGYSRALRAGWIAITTAPRSANARRAALAAAVNDALDTGDVPVFAFGSARSALAACLMAVGIKHGDEVVVSAYTCLAVPTAVLAAGGTPVYCDVDTDTLNANLDLILAVVTPRTRAVVIQHTMGSVVPVAEIVTALRPRGILVIEDCALSVGSRSRGVLVGTTSDAAVFSMELSKTISSGWGGLLVVNDHALASDVARLYEAVREPRPGSSRRDMLQTAVSALCHSPALFDWLGKYVLYLAFKVGWFRLSTPPLELKGEVADDFMTKMGAPQARFATLQWRDFSGIAARCEANAESLRTALASVGAVTPGSPAPEDCAVSPRVSFLVRDPGEAVRFFAGRGMELGRWFSGPLSPPPADPAFNYSPGSYPNAEYLARTVVNLPCHSGVSAGGMRSTIAAVREYAHAHPGALCVTSRT